MNTKIKPEEFEYDGLQKIFQLLDGLDKPYIILTDNWRNNQGELYRIQTIEPYRGEIEYGEFPEGYIPYRQDEGIELLLTHMIKGSVEEKRINLFVNTFNSYQYSVDEIMNRAGIRLPSQEELNGGQYVSGIPIRREEKVGYFYNLFRGRKGTMMDSIKEVLDRKQIPYSIIDKGNLPSFRVILSAPLAPREYVKAFIDFWDSDIMIRFCYNEAATEQYKNSAHKSDLLRFLNYVNQDLIESHGEENYFEVMRLRYAPRVYLDEFNSDQITFSIRVQYNSQEYRLAKEYLNDKCVELMNGLSPYIFGILSGEVDVDEAIKKARYSKEPLHARRISQ